MNPDEHTIAEHMLPVGHGHTLYVQDWGNKQAKHPIIYLHGGPGGQCKDKHKLPFDPETQRVIFFDQRGSGKSTPLGRWHHNTTQDLAEDITRIADFLKLKTFILTGGSWGSTLALYYAIQEPKRVQALVIHGVFTGSRAEINWIDQGLFKTHFPDVWEAYVAKTPQKYRDNPSAYHFERAFGKDESAALKSILAYETLESGVVSLNDLHPPTGLEDYGPSGMLIEMRYMAKRCFMPDRFILKNTHKLTMPVHMIQGRYDMVCPPKTAYELHQLIQNSTLTWVVSGHAGEHETVTAQRLIFRQLTEEK